MAAIQADNRPSFVSMYGLPLTRPGLCALNFISSKNSSMREMSLVLLSIGGSDVSVMVFASAAAFEVVGLLSQRASNPTLA